MIDPLTNELEGPPLRPVTFADLVASRAGAIAANDAAGASPNADRLLAQFAARESDRIRNLPFPIRIAELQSHVASAALSHVIVARAALMHDCEQLVRTTGAPHASV